MTVPSCPECAVERLGPVALEAVERIVANAPPLTPARLAKLRALFHVPVVQSDRANVHETPGKDCGH